MDSTVKAMLERIQWEHWVTEISNTKMNLWWLNIYDDIVSSNQDLYFVSFLPVDDYEQYKWKRTKDSFVKWTTYFKADFDVRSEVFKFENRILNTKDLLAYQHEIELWLKEDELLSTYNAIVFSGNGFHVYRIWKETEIDRETYSIAAWELFEKIKDIFKHRWLPELYPDFACSNISRLMRLPWSINHKKKYGLDPMEVRILYYRDEDSDLISQLKHIWEQAREKEEKRVNDAKLLISKKKRSFTIFDNPLYNSINSNIDIADLVCKYTGWKLAENGKNFISNRDGAYTGCYLIPDENLIVWKGTPHISGHFPVYSPFSFIQIHYANGNVKKTFEKAKELYPDLKSPISELLSHINIEYGA